MTATHVVNEASVLLNALSTNAVAYVLEVPSLLLFFPINTLFSPKPMISSKLVPRHHRDTFHWCGELFTFFEGQLTFEIVFTQASIDSKDFRILVDHKSIKYLIIDPGQYNTQDMCLDLP